MAEAMDATGESVRVQAAASGVAASTIPAADGSLGGHLPTGGTSSAAGNTATGDDAPAGSPAAASATGAAHAAATAGGGGRGPGVSVSAGGGSAVRLGASEGGLGAGAAAAVAAAAEASVRRVAAEALRLARHGRRCDGGVSASGSTVSLGRGRGGLSVGDVQRAASAVLGGDALLGFHTASQPAFVQVGGGEADGDGDKLWVVHDGGVAVGDVVGAAVGRVPVAASIGLHWLAVDGQQPTVSENPPPAEADASQREPATVAELRAAVGTETRPQVEHVLSRELQLYFERVVSVLREPRAEVSAWGSGDSLLDAVLTSLATDVCVKQLVPYFWALLALEVKRNLKNLSRVICAVRAAQAITQNKHLASGLEQCLHQIMPMLLTCVVTKRIGSNPASDNHWAVRDFAARLVAQLVARFGAVYPTLRQRVTKTLGDALKSDTKPVTTHYGAIATMAELGPAVVERLVVPDARHFVDRLDAKIASAHEKDDTAALHAALLCKAKLTAAVAGFIATASGVQPTKTASRTVSREAREAAAEAAKESNQRAEQDKAVAKRVLDTTLDAIRRGREKSGAELPPAKRSRPERAPGAEATGREHDVADIVRLGSLFGESMTAMTDAAVGAATDVFL